ncbi:hypothetical protein AB3X91_07615 [Paraburkholderia sp. BR14263]|uniref:Uncharacterized protein n=1 Tax=Paraburkholderia guartelaensis TaxID=2546446 RepID=A0ABU9SHD3_9BURK
MSIEYARYTTDELTSEKLDSLIASKTSFQIVSIQHMSSVVEKVENRIEKAGLTCRVYTEYRSAAMAGSLLGGVTALAGVASAAAIAAHNLATWDPDYELGKNQVKGQLTVVYKKEK